MHNNIVRYLALLLVSLLLAACADKPVPGKGGGDDRLAVTILQMNDIYELTPVSGGREGGLARVAAIRKELLAKDPGTITVLAGDLFSPSALGTAKVEGQRLAGRQIVDVMNTLGLDYSTFGNHEFDLDEQNFLARLRESRFAWISANVFDREMQSFPGVVPGKVLTLRDAGGRELRLGLFGLTVNANRKDYVRYTDPFAAAAEQVAAMRDKVDVLIALTHLPVEVDISLAATVPGIDLILGGHEHENLQLRRGEAFVPICKADANARTVYVHRLFVDPESREVEIRSELVRVTDQVREDPETAVAVARWQEIGFRAFRAEGFVPERVVASIPFPLDGLEASVRNRTTSLTRLIGEAYLGAVPGAELSLYNSGSVRVDDILPPGPITEYDLIRILPFAGQVCEATLQGDLLRQVLDQGAANRGTGGYLQTVGVSREEKQGWLVNNSPLEGKRFYKVAVNDFLLSGREENLGFFSVTNPKVKASCQERSDIRMVLKEHLARSYPATNPAAPADPKGQEQGVSGDTPENRQDH
ncbi:MAG TPA: bifunctional metallophosphatase/5'-nucleotidase [Desulfobulbaceae bacterium]|nr:bifunctional metallophosphatase/5'-nucleotidase [Desulfobulbaceae bacterium]